MSGLSRRLGRLEAPAPPATPRVWLEDLDTGMLACQRTGERIAVEEAYSLGPADIVVLYADDGRNA